MRVSFLSVGAAVALSLAAPAARADSISGVEGARASERAGRYLSPYEIERLNRWGGNDDGYNSGNVYPYGYAPYGGGDYAGSVYVGPGHGYYGPRY